MKIKEIKKICREYNFTPLRRRGQNFLINPSVVRRVIKEAKLTKEDLILEVGPGLGALTEELVQQAGKVIAIEIDSCLVKILKDKIKEKGNLEIIKASIFDDLPKQIKLADNYKVIANLPFNITGKALRIFLEEREKIKLMILIVQREVAERIVAQPPQMSLLSLAVQFYAHPEIIFDIHQSNFWPQPQVQSTVIKIIPNQQKISPEQEAIFFQIIKKGFSSKRKYLLNNLSKSVIIKKKKDELLDIFKEIDLSPQVRAQELSIGKWLELTRALER
ncbi:16S rRNA (adenine(1518)-N(6)/adenine(1519)-N(6))-dimethyltransferase RsmA [Patescibacteria group bacterium]|nr:16S rRNA (adenine(1518)-N(6)/adenine(1519)-N(6))-dimethyltransferase RsmA [Patescibacteria group bacterium]